MYCLTAIHFPEKREKRRERCFACASAAASSHCKKEGKAISFIDWYYIMEWAQTALRWVKMAKRNESYNAIKGKKKNFLSEVGFEPTPSFEDQNAQS